MERHTPKSLATTIWSRLAGRDRDAVLLEADHRFGLERGQIFPGASAIVGAEQLAAKRVDPAEAAATTRDSGFRDARHGGALA